MSEKRTLVFINELHYRNFGIQIHEGVEIAGPGGTNLNKWSLHFYRSNGSVYGSLQLNGVIPNLQSGFGTLYFPKSNIVDTNSGVALVDGSGSTVQFISYNTEIEAASGPASGLKSQVLPVSETFFTSSGNSIQLVGKGNAYEDFKWVIQTATRGAVNRGQTFVSLPNTTTITTPSGQQEVRVDTLSVENRTAHRTTKYSTQMLIIRRAQEWSLVIHGKTLQSQKFKLLLTAHPEEQTIEIDITDKPGNSDSYYAYYATTSDDAVKVNVYTPLTTPVGMYSLYVAAEKVSVTVLPDPLVILFNPWNKLDTVYLGDEQLLHEYVLNEQGLMWRGSVGNNQPVAWDYAQFQTKSILSALRLLDNIPYSDRGNPIVVSRRMTVLINDYVLEGRWREPYSDGILPTAWTGSKEILNQFYQTNKVVKYAQCWVFAGILTTIMRGLGVPCRPVSNFESAHDTNGNRVVDKYFTQDGRADSDKTNDSVWNFHVWNDAWFSRPDLVEAKYSGWQAIDSTPQETSENEYQCGPCPVYAVKHGEKVDYDWTFIYAEVNADVRNFVKSKDGSYKQVSVQTDKIGAEMSTKSVGKFTREFVTDSYKFKEGTAEERASFNALSVPSELLVSGKIIIPEVRTGNPIPVTIRVNSTKPTEGVKKAKIVITGTVVYYHGKPRGDIVNITQDVELPADGSDVDYEFTISEKEYLPYLNLNHEVDFRVFVYSDKDADVDSILFKRFAFDDPRPEIEIPAQLAADDKGIIKVSFTNPLSIDLTKADITIEGSGVTQTMHSPLTTIPAGQTVHATFHLKETKKKGQRIVKAQVSSLELETVYSFKEVTIA